VAFALFVCSYNTFFLFFVVETRCWVGLGWSFSLEIATDFFPFFSLSNSEQRLRVDD
jgi:hypothetical protein